MGTLVHGPGYQGPDRRRNRVYVTRNTEYFTRDGICVAVRDRRTGEWLQEHAALGHTVDGCLHYNGNAPMPSLDEPGVGDALLFDLRGRELITSPVEKVDRPPREVLAQIPRR